MKYQQHILYLQYPNKYYFPIMSHPPHNHHHEMHVQSSDMLTDIVIGMGDGLMVPFALAAGLSGAVNNTQPIVIAGIAAIVAGAVAMGLGGYLTGKAEQSHYQSELKSQYDDIEKVPGQQKEEARAFFEKLGLSEELQNQAAEEMTKDKQQWADFMMKYELGLQAPNPKRARNSALNIGLSYTVGGIIPLSPYFFTGSPLRGLQYAAIITLICLFIFGFFKSKITGINPWAGALRLTIIGAIAAGAAFGIAKLIEG
jgi:vacuolar iron transporter family protein